MSELLKIVKTEGKVTVLRLEGKVDAQTEKELTDAAQSVFDTGARQLLLDMSAVEMISSAGLRALHTIYKMFTPEEEIQGWKAAHPQDVFKSPHFKLAQPTSQIHYVLSMAGFLQSLYIFPSLKEALDSFSS